MRFLSAIFSPNRLGIIVYISLSADETCLRRRGTFPPVASAEYLI